VGGVSDTFTSTTAAGPDTTPAQFNFTDQTGVAVNTEITSDAVTITGINLPAAVTVTGGTYSVNGGDFTAVAGTVSSGNTVRLRHTSAAAASTATNTTLTVSGVSDTFTSTTAAPVDTTPAPFSFTDQTGVTTSTVITSAAVTITGINSPAAVTIAGGTYSINGGGFTANAGTISNGNTVQVRHTSAATAGTATNTLLTVGGLSDTFTSTTEGVAAGSLLPFMTGTGDLRLFDPEAELAGGVNPRTVDTGLAPPPASDCTADLLKEDCFGKAQAFYTGTVTGSAVSNLHAARLAYINGGAVYKVDLTQSLASILVLPVQISSLTDACRIVRAETTDFLSIDNSAVVIERAGPLGECGVPGQFPADPALDDNVVTVIRLNTTPVPEDADSLGTDIPLVLTAGNPLHAQTDASGVITGYVSFEIAGIDSFRLARRGADLAYQSELLPMEQTASASIERAGLTHLFVTAIPAGNGLSLFRVESAASVEGGANPLSDVLYFFGSSDGNPIQDGLHDATYLYFTHDEHLYRTSLDSETEEAQLITTMVHPDPELSMRIIGKRTLDAGRVVFEAENQGNVNSVASGVFSVAVTATDVADESVITLATYPDAEGGSAYLVLAANGRAYINITHHGATADNALIINTVDGTPFVPTIPSAYWAGANRATSFDLVTDFAVPTQYIFLSRHGTDLVDTLSVVDPATGLEGATIGTVNDTGDFQAVKISGVGRYALARAEIDRDGTRDHDVYFLDAETAGSLTPLAETSGTTDMPLAN
jgi:hypothetical protein